MASRFFKVFTVDKGWSDSAREASIEARRRKRDAAEK